MITDQSDTNANSKKSREQMIIETLKLIYTKRKCTSSWKSLTHMILIKQPKIFQFLIMQLTSNQNKKLRHKFKTMKRRANVFKTRQSMYIPKPLQNEQDGNSLSRVIEQIGVEKENRSDTDSSSEIQMRNSQQI